ncbi:MAG: hypothetical protein ACTJLM_01920 [Ehrlichia sp.]
MRNKKVWFVGNYAWVFISVKDLFSGVAYYVSSLYKACFFVYVD